MTQLHSNVGTAGTPPDHWVTAMGVVLEHEPPTARGRSAVLRSMLSPATGRPWLGVLATMVDLVAGHVPDGPRTPTIDLRLQLVGPAPTEGGIDLVGRPVKVGGRLVVSETTLTDDDGRCFGLGTATFMNQTIATAVGDGALRPVTTIDSFEHHIESRVVDPSSLELDPAVRLSNGPMGTVQGGVQAFLAELATLHLLDGSGWHVVDLDIRYVNRVKVGPLRATARVVGRIGSLATVRVELTDAGDAGRIVAHTSLLAHQGTSQAPGGDESVRSA